MKNRLTFARGMMNVFLWLVLIVMLLPFLWLILSSFRPNMDLFSEPFGIPDTLNLNNYVAVLESHPMFLYLFNTFLLPLSLL